MTNTKTRLSPFSLTNPLITGISPENQASESRLWFIFLNNKLLITKGAGGQLEVYSSLPPQLKQPPEFSQYIGNYRRTSIYVAELQKPFALPENMSFMTLRSLFGKIDKDAFILAGRGLQIIQWNKDYQFCGRCGTKMTIRRKELAKNCPACNFISFPRLSPAVIMSVIRDKEILLARSAHFPKGMYSTLAGFVEPGETLEETVAREVREEVSIEISDIKYIASQPWPFPHSLMIGFSCRYMCGDIQIDNNEIEDAQWFSRDNLPPLPTQVSIARYLIELFINPAKIKKI